MEAESRVIHVYALDYSKFHEEQKERRNQSGRFAMSGEEDGSCSPTNWESTGPDYYSVPIVGYEIVEKRERFTVYKIRVQKQARSWFIFRRYSDFERLNEKLIFAFPKIKLKLPPKRRFGDNFNPDFIAKRAQELQNFIKRILQHKEMRICHATQEFFCLDDPPGPFDSLEESRAYVQYLEEQMEDQKNLVKELNSQLQATKSRLEQARVQIRSLECTLRHERLQRKPSSQPNHSTPAIYDGSSCGPMEIPLSDISDTCSVSKTKSIKSVSFARSKAASEGNLLLLKKNENLPFPTLKDQTRFRHSITFGQDSSDFIYSGFLDVELHSNVTDKIKERKRKSRKQRARSEHQDGSKGTENCTDNGSDVPQGSQSDKKSLSSRKGKGRKREKRDSGIIRDSFTTDSDF